MSVCPGCGRCRQCGQPAPIVVQPWPWQPTVTQAPPQTIWISPVTNTGGPAPQPVYTTLSGGMVV